MDGKCVIAYMMPGIFNAANLLDDVRLSNNLGRFRSHGKRWLFRVSQLCFGIFSDACRLKASLKRQILHAVSIKQDIGFSCTDVMQPEYCITCHSKV